MDLLAQTADGFRTVEAAPALKEQALKYLQQWLTGPEFAAYRPQLEWLIQTKQWAGLLDRFYQILPFGTGGRRGPVGIGPNRMNRWTLGASVQGHCEYLKERFPGVEPLRVIVIYDVRRFLDKRKNYNPHLPNPALGLSSRDLAHHAIEVYAANGIHAWTLPPDSKRFYATPELSFAIRQLGAHGGLNISASHNPPDDNGGKFYDERGGQPVAPDDQIMADLVDQVQQIKVLPWQDAVRAGRVQVVFTPLHGVGAMTAGEALAASGFRLIPVEEQMTPDGQFPNVTQTPNPEAPASMDRAVKVAIQHNADLVLATDPDADRLGGAIPAAASAPSAVRDAQPMIADGWRFLHGNEIAALLTHFKLNKLALQGNLPPSPIVITTEVTTGQITRIAQHFKAQIVNNLLVGFKYHAEVLWQLEQAGAYEDVRGTPADFIIASEESHGILVTPQIRDKDAGGAALLLAELAVDQKRKGLSVLDYLDMLARQFGYYKNEGVPVFMAGIEGKQNMARMLDALRAAPPRQIGGLAVTAFEDLRDERGRMGPLKGATDAAARNFLIFRLGDRAKIVLRPSGTEPKAKTYVEACTPPCPPALSREEWVKSCREADALVKRLADDFQRQALGLIGLTPAAAGGR